MKTSYYNTFFKNGENYLLFNTRTTKLLVLIPEIYNLIVKYKDHVDSLKSIHPDLFLCLKKYGFILSDKIDEIHLVVNTIRKRNNNPSSFELTVNPTLDCNLRCWYCYEDHLKGSRMNEKMIEAVKALIEQKMTEPKLKRFTLSFFGGEPLVQYAKVVLPLIRFAKDCSIRHHKKLYVHFTSNGVLLTRKVVDELADLNLHYFFQIAFDGGKEIHDSIKFTSLGKGCYQQTVDNIRYALKNAHFRILVRCNYTPDNIKSFISLIEDFKDITAREKKRVFFCLKKVWQTEETPVTIQYAKKLQSLLIKYGFITEKDLLPGFTTCYADKENCMVVNYNGNVYKCTARNFTEKNREGTLSDNGSIVFNDRYAQRMQARFRQSQCLTCRAFPICEVCSQKRLEDDGSKPCLAMLTDEDITTFIYQTMAAISKNKIKA